MRTYSGDKRWRRGGRGFHRRRRHGFLEEDYAIVLDFLRWGNPNDRHAWHRTGPVVQLIGMRRFTLMDATPREGAEFDVLEKVYVGPDEEKRLKIAKVFDIGYEDLTVVARDNLLPAVEEIVKSREEDFVWFFNNAGPITLRFHSLELLPGIGKRTLARILEHRPFKSFDDIREKVHIDPVRVIAERIVEELRGGQKYYLFVRPPKSELEQPVPPVFLDYLGRLERERRRGAAREERGETAGGQGSRRERSGTGSAPP